MKLRTTPEGVIAEDPERGRWVSLPRATDMLSLLAGGAEARVEVANRIESVAGDESAAVDPATAGLPFAARSLRAFSLWESHYEGSARMLVKRFFPKPVRSLAAGFERVTRRTFPPFKPNKRFYEVPAFYVGNHAAMLADGEEMPWPSHTGYLDFELELAFVLARPLADPSPAEAREAIGGWLVLNDWSAREVQAEEVRHGVFGPAVKSKTFANSIGCDVSAPTRCPTGPPPADGCGSTARSGAKAAPPIPPTTSARCSPTPRPGSGWSPATSISTGTMPGCCGLELDRWIGPGQTVELEIDGIGTLSNRIGARR